MKEKIKAIIECSKRCRQVVYIRDTYRRTGRGKTGFTIHYERQNCSRIAKDNGFCWQHQHNVLEHPSIKEQ